MCLKFLSYPFRFSRHICSVTYRIKISLHHHRQHALRPLPHAVFLVVWLSAPCGFLCVNHDSFCETVTLVSEVHREPTLALSLAGEFPPLVDCPMVIVLCVFTERICINYSLSSFSLCSIELTSWDLMELMFVHLCVYLPVPIHI